jgi:hypothetical protein
MALILPNSAMIHIPKTGGSFCRRVVRDMGIPYLESGPAEKVVVQRRHAGITQIYDDLMVDNWMEANPKPKQRLVFTFVRNPLTWLQSKWSYSIRTGSIEKWLKERELGNRKIEAVCFSYDFSEFIKCYLEYFPDFVSNAMLGRLGYKKIEGQWMEGDKKVDFIGKSENLRHDLIEVLEKANEDFDKSFILRYPEANVTSRAQEWKAKCRYSPKLRKAVIKANKDLLERFDYPLK